jgi:hypothetical protein
MRQLSLRSPKRADTEGAAGISKGPDRAAHPWTVLLAQDRLGARAQIRLVATLHIALRILTLTSWPAGFAGDGSDRRSAAPSRAPCAYKPQRSRLTISTQGVAQAIRLFRRLSGPASHQQPRAARDQRQWSGRRSPCASSSHQCPRREQCLGAETSDLPLQLPQDCVVAHQYSQASHQPFSGPSPATRPKRRTSSVVRQVRRA